MKYLKLATEVRMKATYKLEKITKKDLAIMKEKEKNNEEEKEKPIETENEKQNEVKDI